MTEIVEVTPGDWAEFREIRLRALADAPDAFGMTLARGQETTEDGWRSRLDTDDPILLVRDGGTAVAMGGGWRPPEEPGSMMIWGMWTAPGSRGCGHAEALVAHLLAWAREHGIADVTLHVAEGNDAARRIYERCGFVATGQWEPLRAGSPLQIELLRMDLLRRSA